MLAGSAAIFMGNIRIGMGAAKGENAVKNAIADAVGNAFGDEKKNIDNARLTIEKNNYIVENISLICEAIKAPTKKEINDLLGDKVVVGITELEGNEKKVIAQIYLVKKAIAMNQTKKDELEDKSHYI